MPNPDPALSQQPLVTKAADSPRLSVKSAAVPIFFLILIAVSPYANMLRNNFAYDDSTQVLGNPYTRSFRHLREIFTTNVWSFEGGSTGVTNYYRPMMTLGYLLCYKLFGLRAFGFHLVSLIVHLAVVLLVFLVTWRLFQAAGLAFVAATIFALHPVHTEPVDWIAAVTELQVSLFYLLTFWLFLGLRRTEEVRSGWTHLGMAGSFTMAILSKEQALTLPLLATVYEHWFRDDRAVTTFAQKLSRYRVLWLLAFGYLVVRIHFLGALVPSPSGRDLSPGQVIYTAVALLGQYLWKLLWPVRLSAYYVFPWSISVLLPWALGGAVALVFCAQLYALLWKRGQIVGFGLVWILATLAPVLNARWMADNVFTERYLYLPSVGFCWLAAWAAAQLWETTSAYRARWRAGLAVVACLLAPLSLVRIVTRNRDWHDDIVLYNTTLAASPDAFDIHNNLGVAYWNQGNSKAAEAQWIEALRLAPQSALTLHNLGLVYKEEKKYDEAVVYFLRALELDSKYADAHLDLGQTYQRMGMRQEAEMQLRAAVSLAPMKVRARNALGEFYFDGHRLDEARDQFRRSIESMPTREGYWGLGLTLWAQGDQNGAERALRNAEALIPVGSRVHFILGLFYATFGRNVEALREYQAGLQYDPTNAEVLAALKKLTPPVPDAKTSKP